MTDRPLRILFFVARAGTLRKFAPLVLELAERGHEIHLAFSREPRSREGKLVRPLTEQFPTVTFGAAPERSALGGWRSVARLVRGLADLARYSHPRYTGAQELRSRTWAAVLHGILQSRAIEPVGRRVAVRAARRLHETLDAERSDRFVRRMAMLEAAIPTSRRIDRYVGEQCPDVVLVTPVVKLASDQIDFLKSARRLEIPTGICIASWDNLTNKGLLRFVPERLFVWNEAQRHEAVELHGIPADRVQPTGAPLFDEWFDRKPNTSREDFTSRVGLDPTRPYALYLCSSPFVAGQGETEFVTDWIEALRASSDPRLRHLGVIVRPHPNAPEDWLVGARFERFENAVGWPARPAHPTGGSTRVDFFDSLCHSAVAVGINTTAMIEAAIVGKSVLTVLAPEFAQESTLHFHHLLEENGGFLGVASSLEEHLAQLSSVLGRGDVALDRRRRFVKSFVRPHGLDRPAAPIMADAIEELAGMVATTPGPSVTRAILRLALTVEAGLCSATMVAWHAAARVRGIVRAQQSRLSLLGASRVVR